LTQLDPVRCVHTKRGFLLESNLLTKKWLEEQTANSQPEMVAVADLKFDKTRYSRKDIDYHAVEDYSKNLLSMPPIIVNQDNVIVDGVHRYKAAQKTEQHQIAAKRIMLDEQDIQLANLLFDLTSGVRHPEGDVKRICRNYWSPNPDDNKHLMEQLGIAHQRFSEYTSDIARAREKERNEAIAYALLDPSKTEAAVAEDFGVSEKTIKRRIDAILDSLPDSGNLSKDTVSESDFAFLCNRYDWKHDLYNIWNKASGDADNSHFGAFPQHFMRNLLYYHTQPLDTVYDPFAGGGTTIDACRFMLRKFIVSDRKPQAHRDEISEWDIANGLPDWLPTKIHLAFLDPPYWKQAEGMYSQDADDLGNMTLEQFNEAMTALLKALEGRKVERIAAVIQPTQYKNAWTWTDHVFDFDKMLTKYHIEARYILPYSTQQYLPQMVEKAKEARICLSTYRDLIVWRRT